MRLVYAGLLGIAQNLLDIIENVDFKKLGVELHVYGEGNQRQKIEQFIVQHDTNVVYHGALSKENVKKELVKYDVSLVPLAVTIKGAVPSKIFELMPLGIPILFCGGGEAANIIRNYNLGLTNEPKDYSSLIRNILTLKEMTEEQRKIFSLNCIETSAEHFDFNKQMNECYNFIVKISKRIV